MPASNSEARKRHDELVAGLRLSNGLVVPVGDRPTRCGIHGTATYVDGQGRRRCQRCDTAAEETWLEEIRGEEHHAALVDDAERWAGEPPG